MLVKWSTVLDECMIYYNFNNYGYYRNCDTLHSMVHVIYTYCHSFYNEGLYKWLFGSHKKKLKMQVE